MLARLARSVSFDSGQNPFFRPRFRNEGRDGIKQEYFRGASVRHSEVNQKEKYLG